MNIRAGKDVTLRWKIFTDGQEKPLPDKESLTLIMQTPDGEEESPAFIVSGGHIVIYLYGKDLTTTGMYSLTLWENKGKQGQRAVDFLNAFRLVANTGLEDDDTEGSNLQDGTVDIGESKL